MTISAGFAVVACSEPTAIGPSISSIKPVTANIARDNPASDGFIVIMAASNTVSNARVGSTLASVVPGAGAFPAGAFVSAKIPSINGLVVRGIGRAQDIEIGNGVVAVVPNYTHNLIDPQAGAVTTSDGTETPQGTNQASAFFFSNNTQWGYKRIQANRAWVPSRGGSGAKVCIVDSGLDEGQSAFTPNTAYPLGKVTMRTSFVDAGPAIDSLFHGTHVAGTISTNGFGWASVAPNASLMIAKVFNGVGGGATTNVVLNAVAWCADNGADVINMSLGFTGGIPRAGNEGFIAAYQSGLDYATNMGVLIVASSGNDSATLPNATNIWLPAEASGVVSVAALGPNTSPGAFGSNPTWTNPGVIFDGIASYSNRGTSPSIAVSAPGGDLGTPSQTLIMSPCTRFYQPSPGSFPCAGGFNGIFAAGTSMASPHVAGVAALIRGRYPTIARSPALRSKIEACLYKTVDAIAPSSTFGRGRVNAYKATSTPC